MRAYHLIHGTPPPKTKEKGIEDVPDQLLVEWSLKLFALMNLTWDYIDTICNVCISAGICETKPLVRAIRELKREYDRFRWRVISQKMEANETNHALRLEELMKDDFTRLAYSLELDINKLDLTENHRMLVLATQQALTLMDAVKKYARYCDNQIKSFGIWTCDCCMVQTEFMKLYPLIPQFAGDCYQPDLNARKLTAGIITNKLVNLKLEQILDGNEDL